MIKLLFLIALGVSAHAQSVKWTVELDPGPGAAATTTFDQTSGDGRGGFAILRRYTQNQTFYGYRLFWITRRGELSTVDFTEQRVVFLRMTRTALYITVDGSLKKLTKNEAGEVIQTSFGVTDPAPDYWAPSPYDPTGFFVLSHNGPLGSVTRYSN